MKFERSWSLGNVITLIVILGSIVAQYGVNSQEVKTIKE